MKIGDKVAYSKWAGEDGIGKIVGVSQNGKLIAVKNCFRIIIIDTVIDDIVMLKESK